MMQKYRVLIFGIAILAMASLFSTHLDVIAQTEETGWPIVKKCMSDLSYPIVPQNKWNFDGVIFNRNSEGVRAIRSDFDNSYFVALASDASFAFSGTFSPDGKWFVYPLGRTEYGGLSPDWVFANDIRIVSTDPAQAVSYKWNLKGWQWTFDSNGDRRLEPIYWFDEQSIIFQGRVGETYGTHKINIHTGEIEQLRNGDELYETARQVAITADWSQRRYRLFDGTGYVSVNPLAVYSNDNQLIEMIYPQSAPYSISPDSNLILFRMDDRLAIADRERQIIYDLCFSLQQFNNPLSFVFSPDSQYFTFLVDHYPVIVDLQTMTNIILDYQATYLLAWFPTE